MSERDSEAKSMSDASVNTVGPAMTPFEALELICDLAGQEWQEPNGERRGAVDNMGQRLWFISEEMMARAQAALARAKVLRNRAGLRTKGTRQHGGNQRNDDGDAEDSEALKRI